MPSALKLAGYRLGGMLATLRPDSWPQAEADKVLRMLPLKYPQARPLPIKMPTPDEVRLFRVTPSVILVLDYTKGFGHTDLVVC